MDKCAIIRLCKELGCCDACCLRYLGLRHPGAYENPHKTLLKYQDESPLSKKTFTTTSQSSPKGSDDVLDTVTPMDVDNTTDVSGDKSSCNVDLASGDIPSGNDNQNTKNSSSNDQISEKPSSSSNLFTDESTTSSTDRLITGNDKVSTDPSSSTVTLPSSDAQCSSSLLPTNTQATADTDTSLPNTSPPSCTPPSDHSSPSPKRARRAVCVTCLGILEEASWPQALDMVQEEVEKKRYSCGTFACALSAPHAALLREAAVALRVRALGPVPRHAEIPIPLKEAWKWSFGAALARRVGKALGSGAVAPLLVTLTMHYAREPQELELLKSLSPQLFQARSKQKKRFAVQFTRRSVEQALEGVTLAALQRLEGWRGGVPAAAAARCAAVACTHSALFLGGRYIKLSRSLPQTPWVLNGERMMETSVQEIIFEPIAKLYGMSEAEASRRMKFMSAGREDVDVRCLGDGRPFAIEIADPRGELTAAELAAACRDLSRGGAVRVERLVHVTREHLMLLKKGEETKTKTYSALCIKLGPAPGDTEQDVATGLALAQSSQMLARTRLVPIQRAQTSLAPTQSSKDLAQTSLAPTQSSKDLAQTSLASTQSSQELSQAYRTSTDPTQSSQRPVQSSIDLSHTPGEEPTQTSKDSTQTALGSGQTSTDLAESGKISTQIGPVLTQSTTESGQTSQGSKLSSQETTLTSLGIVRSGKHTTETALDSGQTRQDLGQISQDSAQTSQDLELTRQDTAQTSQHMPGSSKHSTQTALDSGQTSQDPVQTSQDTVQTSQDLVQTSQDPAQTSQDPVPDEKPCQSTSYDVVQSPGTKSSHISANIPVAVTARDIARLNSYRNTPPGDPARVRISQRTPIRVLHRRPLLTRVRRIYDLSAEAVEGHPHLFVVRVRTEAGTYVKEWAHGELGRTTPALDAALGARADILALDVESVDLAWP